MHSNDLTEREIEICNDILSLMANGEGFSYPKLAKNNFIAESTVKTHINNIFLKLQVNSKAELVYKLAKMESLKHLQSVIADAMLLKNENRLLKHNTPIQMFNQLQESLDLNKKYENKIEILLSKIRQLLKYRTANKIKIEIEKLIKKVKK